MCFVFFIFYTKCSESTNLQRSKRMYISPLKMCNYWPRLSSRMWPVVPAARPQRLRVGLTTAAAPEVRDAVWHRKRPGGEERSLRSVPHGGGLPPHAAQSISEKRCANHVPRWGPQVWPGPHWSLGTLGLDGAADTDDLFKSWTVAGKVLSLIFFFWNVFIAKTWSTKELRLAPSRDPHL